MKTFRKKPLRKASAKAQSAMEYLMTYGWAILIVAVVLGSLYNLGVFNGAAFLGTSCISASGFYCTNPTLSTGGVLTVTIGQATGTTFNNAYLYFVPSGTNFSNSDPSTSIGTLNSGQQVTVSIPLRAGSPYPAAYTLGTPLSGYLYLQFTDIYGTTEVNKIATVLTKVTATSSAVLSQSPTSIPSGIVAYVPITLSNSQSSATPSPFQQMIQINEGNYANYITYNGNIANFEFFTQSGSVLPAWIESNNSGTLTVWVKLPNGIPASSSLAIYLGFASKTTNLLSSSGTSGIGEAPQLSCPNPANTISCSTYAEYDDGASVFSNYWNFAGTSLPSDFTSYLGSNAILSVDNGLHIQVANNDCSSTWAGIIYNNPINAADSIVETYSSGARGPGPEDVGLYTGNSDTSGGYAGVADTWGWGFGTISGGYGNIGNPFDISSGSGIASIYWIGNGDEGVGWNYDFVSSTNTAETWSSSLYSSIQTGQCSPGGNMMYYWYRVRAYPPNGVMPSVSFGGLSTA